MKPIHVIIAFILVLTLLYPLLRRTGFGSQSTDKILVEVIPSLVFIETDVYRTVYCIGENIDIINTLYNYNYSSIYGNMSVELFNHEVQTTVYYESLNDTIGPRQTKIYTFNYTLDQLDPLGWYTATGNFSFNNGQNFTSDNAEFEVWSGIGSLIAAPPRIEKTIMGGNYSSQNISMWLDRACNSTTAILNATPGAPGSWVSFSPGQVFLPSTELNTSTANISVPANTPEGNYTGNVFVYADGQRVIIPLMVRVSYDNIFDLSVSIPSTKKEVCPGDEVYAVVNITKIKPPGVVDINMTYQLLNSSGAVLDEKKETVAINNTLERIPTLHAPNSAPLGYYTFVAILNYNLSFVQSSDMTRVVSCELPPIQPTGPTGAPGLIILPQPNLTLNVSAERLWVLTGNKTSFIASVKNIGLVTIKSVRLLIEGIPIEWFNIIPGRADIPSDKMQEYLVLIDVPRDAKPGIYSLNITAIDDAKSNTKRITLFVGKDYKQIAELMLEELTNLRRKTSEIEKLNRCLDISEALKIADEAEKLIEKGLAEYEKKDFEKTVYWFDYAISSFEKIPGRIDVIIEAKIESLKRMNALVQLLYGNEINRQLTSARIYMYSRNYGVFCEPIVIIERLQLNGKVIMLGLLGLIIVASVVTGIVVRMYKKKKELEKGILLRRVRERIDKIGSESI